MSATAIQTTFPNMWVEDSKKGEDYHKQAILAILGQTVANGYIPNLYIAMDRSMNFYNGDYDISKKFDFLQKDYNGRSLPALWINFNKIRNKINLLEGEVAVQKLDVSCKTLNRDAVSRKMKKRSNIIAEKIMMSIIPQIDPSGELLQVKNPDFVPYSEEELDLYMQSSYKEPIERAMDSILKYEMERNKYVQTRLAFWRDILITGRAVGKHELRYGKPHIRRVDPRYIIIDPYVFDDSFSTASFVGEWRYAPVTEVCDTYGLTLEELDKVRFDQGSWLWGGYSQNGSNFLLPYISINNQFMCLVFYAEWRDIRQVRAKVTVDQYGGEHVKILGKDDKSKLTDKEKQAGAKIEERNIETIRKATLIGSNIVKEWGEMNNIVRDKVDNPVRAEYSYTIICPQYVNFRGVSKVEEMSALQEFKDLIMYTIQQEMSTAGRKGFIYDLRFKPDNLQLQDVMYYLKTAGIAFTSSGQEGVPPAGNPFPTIDTGISNSITLYLNLASYIDMEIDKISGINDARQGFQKGDALVGVSQMAVTQSSLITQPLNKAFEIFENEILQKYANYIKTIFPFIKEQYEAVMSQINIDALEVDEDIPLQDYGIFVRVNSDDIMNNRQKFENMVMTAVQANSVNLADAMVLLYTPDTKEAVKKFLSLVDRKNAEQQEIAAQQAQMAQQLQQQQAANDIETQVAVDKARSGNKGELQVLREQLKNQTMQQQAELDMLKREQEQNFQLILEAIKEQKPQ
jgi:hypothetical protein